MAKVFFLNPAFYGVKGFVREQRWFARTRGRVSRAPDYALVAVAVLEKSRNKVMFLDCASTEMPFEDVKGKALRFKPDMIVIPATTPSIYNDIKQASELKKTLGGKPLTILIGSHVSALPEQTLKIDPGINVIARGEYDYTLRDIAFSIDKNQGLEGVLGITYRKGNYIRKNPDRPFIENLDELPFPAWHHIDPRKYFDAGKLYPFLTIIAGRGCPNYCSFCLLPQTLYGRKYRLRSAESIADEIEHDLKMFPYLKEIMFEDDTLTANKERCREICEEIMRRGLHRKLSFSGNSRADIFDPELFSLMKKANFRMLVVGFEFGDQKVLNSVRKGETIENMKRFSKVAKKAGLRLHGCFMIGGPGETMESANKTIQLIKNLACDTIQVSALIPYPGTEFYDYCQRNNLIKAKRWTEWVDGGEQCTVIEYPGLTKEQIVNLVDKGLYESFYLRPNVWAHHIMTVRDLSDMKRKVKGFYNLLSYRFGAKGGK